MEAECLVLIQRYFDLFEIGCGVEFNSIDNTERMVMLTASELDGHLDRAIRLGVAGYLLKDLDASELLTWWKASPAVRSR